MRTKPSGDPRRVQSATTGRNVRRTPTARAGREFRVLDGEVDWQYQSASAAAVRGARLAQSGMSDGSCFTTSASSSVSAVVRTSTGR
jgi:hypothetical protein